MCTPPNVFKTPRQTLFFNTLWVFMEMHFLCLWPGRPETAVLVSAETHTLTHVARVFFRFCLNLDDQFVVGNVPWVYLERFYSISRQYRVPESCINGTTGDKTVSDRKSVALNFRTFRNTGKIIFQIINLKLFSVFGSIKVWHSNHKKNKCDYCEKDLIFDAINHKISSTFISPWKHKRSYWPFKHVLFVSLTCNSPNRYG